MDRWREYFDKLFNGESESPTLELDDSFDDTNRRFVRSIQEVEIGEALKRMKRGKVLGPDGILIEVWRCLGDREMVWLTKLFNLILRSNMMPEEWRRSILVPIFKNKGDVQSCTNYRGIKLMSHTMKALGEGYRASPKKSDKCDPKPIWVHAWKVNHGVDFLNTTIDGEI